MQCVILAGGLGTRIRSIKPDTAKSMIVVADKPFIAWQLEWLRVEGVSDVVISIGHLGEQIREFVADGQRFDLRVRYIDEGERLLGTAGALRLASDAGVLHDRFFTLYGDSYLDISLVNVWRHFEGQERPALMTVYRNDNEGEVSNVVFDGTVVSQYAKNDPHRPHDMVYVDYGLLVLTPALISENVAPNVEADLSKLLEFLSWGGNLAGFEATTRFFEIGSPRGLDQLERELRSRSSNARRSGN